MLWDVSCELRVARFGLRVARFGLPVQRAHGQTDQRAQRTMMTARFPCERVEAFH